MAEPSRPIAARQRRPGQLAPLDAGHRLQQQHRTGPRPAERDRRGELPAARRPARRRSGRTGRRPLGHVDRARRVRLGVADRGAGRVERAERRGPLGGVLDQLAGDPAGRQRGQLRAGGRAGRPGRAAAGRPGRPTRPRPVPGRATPRARPPSGTPSRCRPGAEHPHGVQLLGTVDHEPVGHPQALADPVLHPDQLAAGHVAAEQPGRGARRRRPGPAAGPGPAAPGRGEAVPLADGQHARSQPGSPWPVHRTVSTPVPARSSRTVTASPARPRHRDRRRPAQAGSSTVTRSTSAPVAATTATGADCLSPYEGETQPSASRSVPCGASSSSPGADSRSGAELDRAAAAAGARCQRAAY